MDENTFQVIYDKAMEGSLDDLIALSTIYPTNRHYNSQIGRVFNVLHYRMNLPRSPTTSFEEHVTSATAFCFCLTNLFARNGSEVSASLSEGFLHAWPVVWDILESVLLFSLTQHDLPAETRQLARTAAAQVCSVLGRDDPTITKMISTSGFNSFVLRMWSMEVEHPDYQLRDDERRVSMAAFLDRVFSFSSGGDEKHKLEQFLTPMNGDVKSLAFTALKHLHHAFYRKRPNLDCVIWNIHIMTVLGGDCDSFRNALLAQNCIAAVTKVLVAMTAKPPYPTTASLKAKAIRFSFWNLMPLIQSTDGATWIIQALEAKLIFALLRCEPWLPYMGGDPTEFFYPFLDKILPNYTAYRSVLCRIEKNLAKVQQMGLDSGKFQDVPLWNAWNSFVELAKARIKILQLTPGGLLRAPERCHNAQCARDKAHGEFRQCVACLSAQYCSKECQTYDWKFGGHKTFCRALEARRLEGRTPDISKGDFEFMGAIIEAERLRMQDAIPEMFRTVNKKLVVLSLDFRVCPPTTALLAPEDFDFCEYHDNGPLRERWEQLRREMDALVHPTLMICARVERGQTSVAVCRLVTTTLNEKSDELVVYKGVGCSC